MPNIKSIAIGATVGFVLSLLIGLFSEVNFGILILRAFIFALVGGGVGYGSSFCFEHFLDQPQDSSSGDSIGDASVPQGSVVNITVDGENLPEDENSPKFIVTNNNMISNIEPKSHSGENSGEKNTFENKKEPENIVPPLSGQSEASGTTISQEKTGENPVPLSNETGGSFQPFNMASAVEKVDSASVSAAAPQKNEQSPKKTENNGGNSPIGELDMLPDIGNLNFLSKKNENSDIINDSEFASESSSSGGEFSGNSNTAEMAMAIRTLLAKDKS